MQISFLHGSFQKNSVSCWEHILGKVLSHLFICILFTDFICGFLDFIIASFSLLMGFIFFICGCLILLKFAFRFLLLNFSFYSVIISNFHLKGGVFFLPNSATKRCFVAFDPQCARNGIRGRYRARWKTFMLYFEAHKSFFELHTSGTVCDDIRHT